MADYEPINASTTFLQIWAEFIDLNGVVVNSNLMNVVLSINNPCKNPAAIQTSLNKVEDTNVAQFNEDGTSRTTDFGPVFDPLYIQIQAGDPITIYCDLLDLYT